MAGSQQHRCVFVGNIPYDATEEQLIQICEEVGPVVSFRLVVDRETGKPKGYGFCEYKDEETALSARRNLQGYEINGRQLRVDFAENDKGVDRNREQGRGGPGMAANVDGQKQGASAVLGDPLQQHHPIGLPSAMTAATVMAGALGPPQVLHKSNQNGWKNQSALGSDPLTLHLAKMSRNQLNGILCELKEMATQNKELARQLLDANPHLLKALFQAEIMLGMATPQMPSLQDRQQVQQSAFQTLSGLPPLAQGNMQFGIVPRVQEGQAGAANYYSLVRSQLPTSSQPPPQPQVQVRLPDHDQFQHPMLPCQDDVSTDASLRPEFLPNVPIRPQTRVPISSSSSSRQPMHSLLQHSGQVGAANLDNLNARVQPSFLTQPPKSGSNFQLPSGAILGTSDWSNTNKRSSLPTIHPSKLAKLDGGRSAPLTVSGSNPSPATASWQPEFFGMGSSLSNQLSKAEEAGTREKQVQLPPEVESALLQQVVNLTPEQLRSLPSEQQHQVIQLQQMLR